MEKMIPALVFMNENDDYDIDVFSFDRDIQV